MLMKHIPVVIAVLLIAGCSGPRRVNRVIHEKDSVGGENRVDLPQSPGSSSSSEETPPPEAATLLPILPPQWPGMAFIVLQKQEFMRPLGYELYLCKKKECDTARIDPFWELDNHRIRCERIAGDTLIAETVETEGDEWTVTFLHVSTNRKIFGRTRRQTIPEIAPIEDLEGARRRWLGKTVFSRRGIISAFSSGSGTSLTGIRVNITDSLAVTGVRWGTMPLPVKPIWLMVSLKNGKSGFIPVRYSWTNTIPGEIKRCAPWEEEIFEANPAAIFDWDDNMWELVNNHRVIIGMTPDQVRISWGEPLSTRPINTQQGERLIMTYVSHELFFSDEKLIAIKERPQQQE